VGTKRAQCPEPSPNQPDALSEREVERDLLLRVQQGDGDAFGCIVDRHIERAFALAYRVLNHREDAEDLVQDAFLTALEHIRAFDTTRAFWPWLARIIVNRGLDLASARSVRVTEPIPEDTADPGASPASVTERREILERFRHALALLPARQRLVMQLIELDGHTTSEVAEMLDSSASTVRWHLHMGRDQLRRALAPFRRGDS
jgi:RNA polymerase sigma-70 factor (ECF subfamily)